MENTETVIEDNAQPSETDRLADTLYTTYCKEVGGIAFNGDPLPSWYDFARDPNKTKQSSAWRVVAETAMITLGQKNSSN